VGSWSVGNEMAGFDIEIADLAADELRGIRAFDRQRILDEIHSQLENQPTLVTRNRKRLDGVVPGFEHVPPIWELRVGEFRVFYDVDESTSVVAIRAVRRKQPGQKTEDVIHENDNG
jgi:mRNA-degrading endonuclease RelE of RelBE toxin-antitoxin system